MYTLNVIKTIKYCLKFVYPSYNPYLFLIYLMIKRNTCSLETQLKLVGIPKNVHRKIVKGSLLSATPRDISKCLIINQKNLNRFRSENIFFYDNGSVWLTAIGENQDDHMISSISFLNINLPSKSKTMKRERIVQVVGSEDVLDDMIICSCEEEVNIRSLFWFNHEAEDVFLKLSPITNVKIGPRLAERALVHLVSDNHEIPNEIIVNLLNEYFENPKLIYCDDIFEVKVTDEIISNETNLPQFIVFKCSEIKCKDSESSSEIPYFIVKGRTELKIGENILSLVPYEKYFGLEKQLTNICPYGMSNSFNEILLMLMPFLKKSLTSILHDTTFQPMMPLLLLNGKAGTGKNLVVQLIAKYHGYHHLYIDCNSLQSTTAKQTEGKLVSLLQRAKSIAPVIVTLDHFDMLITDAEGDEDNRILDYFMKSIQNLFENFTIHPIIFIATSTKSEMSSKINRIFMETVHLKKLDSDKARRNLNWFFNVLDLKVQMNDSDEVICGQDCGLFKKSLDSRLDRVSRKMEGLSHGEMELLIHFAQRISYMRQIEVSAVTPDLHFLKESDLDQGLEHLRTLQSQHVDRPKIPEVYWDDIGGLQHLKKELIKTIELPIKYPHLFNNSLLKRSGILLYGPPGCGKTLVAKAVSTELNISFLSVKGPELLNMYIGQSEENVRKVFESARESSPCLVFLDELDSLAPRRGASGDSGGASDRVVSQLLAELDGVDTQGDDNSSKTVFVMGATNRPDLLEQSLLRPGRLDKLIYVGPYVGAEEKTRVLTALTRKYKLNDDIDLQKISLQLPERCTGADLLHVTSAARSSAVRRKLALFKEGKIKQSELKSEDLIITTEDLQAGVDTFKPSITDEEFQYYESLKSQM